jgi:Ni,Fe-hydrogenase III small subunit
VSGPDDARVPGGGLVPDEARVPDDDPVPGGGAREELELRRAIRRTLGRSLHVRHLDVGSCNGCDWEIAALLNPYHDVQRLGIDFVASPRHADLLLVTGIMTRNLEDAALRTYQAMPEPRLVVAVGACAISGGVFAGTYAGRDGIGEVLPVDVFVPGCPPRPEALIHGLLVAVGRLPSFSAPDA